MVQQYKLRGCNQEMIDALIIEYKGISGRSIRQLSRLVKVLSVKRGKKIDLEMFKEASGFMNLEKEDNEKKTG